jgi:hypothetical protein
MESVVREALYVYTVDVDSSDVQKFMYRDRAYRWSTTGPHVCFTRYDEVDGSLRLTFWHNETKETLWPKLNLYLQSQ